jgi:hypothetical protein
MATNAEKVVQIMGMKAANPDNIAVQVHTFLTLLLHFRYTVVTVLYALATLL